MWRRALQHFESALAVVLVVLPLAGCVGRVSRGTSSFKVLGAPNAGLPAAQAEVVAEDKSVRIDYLPLRAEAPLARPIYPPAALKAGAGEHTLYVTIAVDAWGNVTDVTPSWWRIAARKPFADDFLEAVKAAVKSWRLAPARQVYYRRNASGEEQYERTEAIAETVEVEFVFDASEAVR